LLERISELDIEGLVAPRHELLDRAEISRLVADNTTDAQWTAAFAALCRGLDAEALVIKPRADGCSTGVKLIANGRDLALFTRAVVALRDRIAPGSFGPGSREIRLPVPPPHEWIIEQALVADEDEPPHTGRFDDGDVLQRWFHSTRFIELTCGVIESDDGLLTATTPTISMAADSELSLEEKFQQGTGTNLLLSSFLSEDIVASLRQRIATLAAAISLSGFARIDGFYDRRKDELVVIEVNTLCAMTEATVFYTQVLDTFGWSPPETLARIARLSMAAPREDAEGTARIQPLTPWPNELSGLDLRSAEDSAGA
jgi:hypothetical protein